MGPTLRSSQHASSTSVLGRMFSSDYVLWRLVFRCWTLDELLRRAPTPRNGSEPGSDVQNQWGVGAGGWWVQYFPNHATALANSNCGGAIDPTLLKNCLDPCQLITRRQQQHVRMNALIKSRSKSRSHTQMPSHGQSSFRLYTIDLKQDPTY